MEVRNNFKTKKITKAVIPAAGLGTRVLPATKSIPKEIYDAAAIDGCGPVRLFLRLLLPMSGNALASLAILSMITAWNQYIWPLLVTNKNEMRTVQVGISMLQGLEFSDYTLVMAGIVLVLLPCVLIFVVGFRFFIAGITEGAVKG